MKVLFLSNPTWDNTNSYGNTFSNLFEGMPEIEAYNISCASGKNNNSIVKKALQITDKDVLKSIIHPGYDPFNVIEVGHGEDGEIVGDGFYKQLVNKRYTIFFLIREIIWYLGRWKKSKKLNHFLKEVNPDVVYVNIYGDFYNFASRLQLHIIRELNIPVVGHINDDNYTYLHYGFAPLKYLLHHSVRRNLIKIVKRCSYVECFAPQMKIEYEKLFNIPFHVIGKGLRKSEMPSKYRVPDNHRELTFAYTGNLGAGRYEILYQLGKNLDEQSKNHHLVITSGTIPTDDMLRKFSQCQCIDFRGSVPYGKIKEVQQNADYLIHVDNFDAYNVSTYRLSFATKIVDCLSTGNPLIAIGPNSVNTIQELNDNHIAIVIKSIDDIRGTLEKLFNGEIDVEGIQKNVKYYLENKRDIKVIQSGILQRLKEVINDNN